MKALLWKEYREKRLWLFILTLSIVLVTLKGFYFTFVGAGGFYGLLRVWDGVGIIPILLSAYFGAGAFSSEIRGSSTFLFSLPASWKKLLLCKLIVGLAVIIASAVLSALVFRLICPERYIPFATFERLGWGIIWAVMILGTVYLIGLMFSTVFSEPAGGLLISLITITLMMLHLMLIYKLFDASPAFAQFFRSRQVVPFPFLGWLAAPVAALLITSRFGLTLYTKDRLIRFFAALLAVVVSSTLLILIKVNPGNRIIMTMTTGSPQPYTSISPDAGCAIIHGDQWHLQLLGKGNLKETLSIETLARPEYLFWLDPKTVVYDHNSDDVRNRRRVGDITSASFTVAHMDVRNHVTLEKIDTSAKFPGSRIILPSPGGRYFLLVPADVTDSTRLRLEQMPGYRITPGSYNFAAAVKPGSSIGLVECGKKCSLSILDTKASTIWWQSEDTLGYRNEHGQWHTIRVSDNK